jgi:hypothetical protein
LTYGNPDKVKFQSTEALINTLWIDAKPDAVVADPFWGQLENQESDICLTQPPVQDILDIAVNTRVPGIVLRLSTYFGLALLTRWGAFELEKVFIQTYG